jgi:hypothetical protein
MENPYESPLGQSSDEQPAAPGWRRIAALPLMILGGFFFVCGALGLVMGTVPDEVIVYHVLGMLVTSGMLAAGIWLRRSR